MSYLSVFRGVRLIKLLERDYAYDELQVVILVLKEGSRYLLQFIIILVIEALIIKIKVLYMYVFAVLGMKIFAGQMKFNSEGEYDPVSG
jgi:hypothetical protein